VSFLDYKLLCKTFVKRQILKQRMRQLYADKCALTVTTLSR